MFIEKSALSSDGGRLFRFNENVQDPGSWIDQQRNRTLMSKRMISTLVLLATLTLTLCGCVASSNFYSGRTLEEGKVAVAIGADDIAMGSRDESVSVSKSNPLSPSIGAAVGLPLRLELGLRYFPTQFIEVTMRDQLNPRTFTIADFSLDLHYAILMGGYSYFRYGVTLQMHVLFLS